jgi:hypothetical protein
MRVDAVEDDPPLRPRQRVQPTEHLPRGLGAPGQAEVPAHEERRVEEAQLRADLRERERAGVPDAAATTDGQSPR